MLKALRFAALPASLVAVALLGGAGAAAAQNVEYRAIDGSGNHRKHRGWGATHDTIVNSCRTNFSDGFSEPAGVDLPNVRAISNVLFRQTEDMPSPQGLNDLFWAFGQFLDHDVVLTHNSKTEAFPISIPMGDAMFDPQRTGRATIPMMRSGAMGGDANGVRRYPNELTAFIDGSAVYGESAARATWLRSFRGGKLKVSAGHLPPFNTLNGEFGGPIDREAPAMDGMRSPTQRVMVCGDVRANENSLLASVHTLWLREHNWLCDSLAQTHPTYDDEALYQAARRLLIAELQHVVYDEWLPALGIRLGAEVGYDAEVHPGISNEFAAAGFRFGHSLVGSALVMVDERGAPTANSPIALRDVFFDPVAVVQRNGVGALIRGASTNHQQTLDAKVVEDLRSFLFGAPGQGGMDLVAINIQRGRDRGLAGFGAVRDDLGLAPVSSFEQLTGETTTAARLREFYGTVDNVDPWVGMLSERRDGVLGVTLRTMLTDQFRRLRAGDRLFAAHEGNLSAEERAWVGRQTLSTLAARSSGIQIGRQSFRAAPLVGLAFAKTDRAEPIQARVSGGELLVSGSAREVRRIILTDVVGRTIAAWTPEANGFDESRDDWQVALPLGGAGLPAGTYACAVEGERGVASALVQVLR